jgi:hypothetical protein
LSIEAEIQDLEMVIKRCVDSNLPLLAYSDDHSWLVVGYKTDPDGPTRLVLHDDQEGPYIQAGSLDDGSARSPERSREAWHGSIIPLPEKSYLSGEQAELIGRVAAKKVADEWIGPGALEGRWYRCYLVSGNDFKVRARHRLSDRLRWMYQSVELPRYVWVLEILDQLDSEATADEQLILGEVVMDSTAHQLSDFEDAVLCVNLLGKSGYRIPDREGFVFGKSTDEGLPYRSGIRPDVTQPDGY